MFGEKRQPEEDLTKQKIFLILNIVHFEEVRELHPAVTSKEAILQVSRELIRTQGWAAVNMRTVAKTCGISIGSIYNYFENKSELVMATVESVWQDIFYLPKEEVAFQDFAERVQWIFARMEKGNETYPNFFTMHAMSFLGEDQKEAQKRMVLAQQRIKGELYTALQQDQKVRADAFDDGFSGEAFIEILFSLLVSALLQQQYDHRGVVAMVKKLLYED